MASILTLSSTSRFHSLIKGTHTKEPMHNYKNNDHHSALIQDWRLPFHASKVWKASGMYPETNLTLLNAEMFAERKSIIYKCRID